MFGGKREKALEEEILALKELCEKKDAQILKISEQKDVAEEQFAHLTVAHAKLSEVIAKVQEQMETVHVLTEGGANVASDFHHTIVVLNNALSSFEVNHSVFLKQMHEQAEKITDIVDNNKHFTTPMKHITEEQANAKEERKQMQTLVAEMMDLGKDMSVLSLNAAIEAGRMGEDAKEFVLAAEAVRNCAEKYENNSKQLSTVLQTAEKREAELEEQIHHLNELLKENNISMGKVYKDALQNLSTYETKQEDVRGLLPDEMVGRTDALKQSGEECVTWQNKIMEELQEVATEVQVYKDSVDELETVWKNFYQFES